MPRFWALRLPAAKDFRLEQGKITVNHQDKSFLTIFTAIMGILALVAVAIFFIAKLVSTVITYQGDDASRLAASVEKRLAPVGRVAISGEEGDVETAAPAAELTGEQVVAQACAACHQAGVLQAPKIGSKEEWQPRLTGGLDALVANAINGINAMPARGGNPDLSDELVREATLYMLAQSGIEAGNGTQSEAEGQDDQAPSAPARGIAGETGKAESVELSGSEQASADSGGVDVEKVKTLYGQACAACHDTGAANAPKLGDKAAWEPRLAKGSDVLLDHAINGFNAMPPKGGAMHLSEGDIEGIVGYMVQSSK